MNYKKIVWTIALVIFFPLFVNAQQTGKIAGIIKDKNTTEPLIGVNVYIESISTGAATNIDGYYAILNIHPGKYSIVVSMVGYRKMVVNNIHVSSGKTTVIDLEMEEESTKLEGEVIVTAKREIVKRDLTSSELSVSAEEIKKLPVENLNDVIKQKAGVVTDAGGNIHIRGGRASEVGYMIDGISVKDNYSGARSAEVDVQFMQEVKVISGVFNAEYGQAMSGIVDVITKQGSDKFEANINLSAGDYLSGDSKTFYNIKDVNPFAINDIKASLSGPLSLFDKKIRYSLALRRYENDGYLYGKRRFNMSDSSYMQGDGFYIDESGDNKVVAMNNSEFYNAQAKVNVDLSEKIKIYDFLLFDKSESRYYNHNFKYNPDGIPTNYKTSYNNIFNLTYVLSQSSFLTFKYSYGVSENKTYVFENINDSRYANPELLNKLTNYSFLSGGTDMSHNKRRTETHIIKGDFLTQFNQYNEIKTGVEFRYDNIDVTNSTAFYKEESPVFSFNQFINEGDFNYTPTSLAYYIQDKLEYKSVIINAGLRFDYFDAKGEVPTDYRDPVNSKKTNSKAQTQWSPRLGLAFPISADGTIHFSYGHFFRMPDYEYLYYNPNFRVGPGGLYTLMGNANLKAESTVAYEIGLHYKFLDRIGLEVIGFYKDVSNLLGTEIKNTYVGGDRYALYTNRDYGKSRGVTVSLFKRNTITDPLSVSLDYTFQISESNASDPNDAFNRGQGNPPKQPNIQVIPVNWDQRHTINMSLFYTLPENFNFGIIAKYESGFPYTPENQSIQSSFENGSRMPDKINLDLQFFKDFHIANQKLSFYVKVYNLLDIRNEIDVYRDTGRANSTLISQYTPEKQGPNSLSEYLINPTFYSEPRRIILGLNYDLNF